MTILEKLNCEYPDAGTMLHFESLFQLLIAVILSAQSTDEQVNRVTADLFQQYTLSARNWLRPSWQKSKWL